MEDKKRIMDMVKEGKITVEEALRLLEAMESGRPKAATPSAGYAYAVATTPPPTRGIARMVRIVVDGEDVKIKVNIPAALAKFASNFIPPEAQRQLTAQGIDIAGILDMLKGELPEGRLVDVEINDVAKMSDGESKISGPMKVLIEVV
ncbi:hypothetical protein [Meiothermus sp.]|uniref:SHOCT-like domain-containing protein n=1 Tax=Meiothermus sp. TaxID=1955249 RepID=UPI00307D381B